MEDAVTFDLTAEQEKIRAAYKRRRNLVINAYAGTGKTTMLRLLALADPYRQLLYIAYNKTAQLDAAASFPSNAICSTSHGLAFKPMIHMARRISGSKKYVKGIELARLMKITAPVRLTPDKVLAPGQFASVVKATIKKFSYSADEKIGRRHIPNDLRRFTEDEIAALRILVPPVAQRVWDEDITTEDGVVPMDHDFYLKAYQLKHPRLFKNPQNAVIALDEAQDSNPCVAALILEQIQYGVQVIMVGDTYQQIYGWRGAEDAMTRFAEHPGVEVLSLTQSFRFGEAVAGEGNKLLTVLGAPAPLRGFAQIESRVGPIPGAGAVPDAELTRTNAEAFRLAIEYIGKGVTVSFPKGAGELMGLVKGAAQIKRGEPCEHPDLMAFATWGQVQDYCLVGDAKILHANLRYERADMTRPGDTLVAFDEEQLPGNIGRRFRTAVVESVKTITRPCVRITTSDGQAVTTSIEHRWLVKSGNNLRWCQAQRLQVGTHIMSIGRWDVEDTRSAGWLAGMFDGEGYVGGDYETSRTRHVGVAQQPGPALDRLRYELASRKFQFGDYGRTKDSVRQLTIKGGVSEQLRFLGQIRPERLVAKAERIWNDRRVERTGTVQVVSVEYVGELDVVSIQTDRRTFIAEGMLSHNCENEPDGQDLKLFVELVDQHGVDELFEILRQIGNEDKDGKADITISTAHSAKGREWRLVRIARDFLEPKQGDRIPREMAMLLYVALTRAQYVLDCASVAWINDYLGRPAVLDAEPEPEPDPAAPAAPVNGWHVIRDAEVAYREELANAR